MGCVLQSAGNGVPDGARKICGDEIPTGKIFYDWLTVAARKLVHANMQRWNIVASPDRGQPTNGALRN